MRARPALSTFSGFTEAQAHAAAQAAANRLGRDVELTHDLAGTYRVHTDGGSGKRFVPHRE